MRIFERLRDEDSDDGGQGEGGRYQGAYESVRRCRRRSENSSSQLLLYSELARRLMPDRDVRLRFLVLTKTKSPTVESFDVDVSQHQVHRITKAVEHTWRAIEAGHFYPAPSPMNCPTCPFRSECNAWTG